MPRIFNQGPGVDDWHKETDEGTSGFGVCRQCWPKIKKRPEDYFEKLAPYNGDPQGTHYGTEGVPLAYGEGETCEGCGRELTGADDEG
jgi:hypothetical protein